MKLVLRSLWLAWRDWWHERGFNVCSVIALASILLPLLVIHGVHMGVITSLKTRLMTDPSILVVVPLSGKGAGFSEKSIEEIRSHRDVDFVIGRTRDVAAEMQLVADGRFLTVTLEPTGAGDPLLEKAKIAQPEDIASKTPGIVLSQSAARRLAVKKADKVQGKMSRRLSTGKVERLTIHFTVVDVLPVTATGMDAAFLPIATLNAIQDFRDALDVPALGVKGERSASGPRFYESFRLYAKSLEGVEALDAWFEARHILVRTKAKEIASVRKMDEALGSIVLFISAVVSVGFVMYMLSVGRASVQRKKKALGMLRLLGFTRGSVMAFPIWQSFLTGLFGALLGFGLYAALARMIDLLFAESTGGEAICSMPVLHGVAIFAAVAVLSALAALVPGVKASNIEPSSVLRDV